MKLKIGKGPDLRLIRDRELLSYSAVTLVKKNNRVLEKRVFSNFRLAIVCQTLQVFCTAYQVQGGTVEMHISAQTIEVSFSAPQIAITVSAVFKLPADISAKDVESISGFIDNFFENSKPPLKV